MGCASDSRYRRSAQAKTLKGYLIEVEGFTDSSGNAALNQKLSMKRSQAVVNRGLAAP